MRWPVAVVFYAPFPIFSCDAAVIDERPDYGLTDAGFTTNPIRRRT
jgi:hypothetical protein